MTFTPVKESAGDNSRRAQLPPAGRWHPCRLWPETRMTMAEDRKLRVAEAATRAGVKPKTWTAAVSRGHAPRKDGAEDGRTPFWFESTIDAFLASRPGQGHRSDRPPKPAAEEPGDLGAPSETGE